MAFVYTALGLAGLLMLSAVVVDMGLLYQRKAEMQRTADAAALAGAQRLANFRTSYEAYVYAGYMASLPQNGGYTTMSAGLASNSVVYNKNGSNFRTEYPVKDEDGNQQNSWFRVTISKPEPALFSGFWPLNRKTNLVTATATALYETLAPLEIKGQGTYGVAPGPVNLSVFGPDGRYSYGDPYSTKFLNDGTTANPNYNSDGYNFLVNVPLSQKKTWVEIFDPDCYNAGNVPDASATTIDEYRTRTGTGTVSNATTTKYTLFWDKGTSNPSDDVEIANRSYGADSSTDMKWNSVFEFDRSAYTYGNFRLNIKSTAGSSENGFDLRAGPERVATTTTRTETYISGYYYPQYFGTRYPIYSTRTVTDTVPAPDFDPNNGTSIQAEGHLPINFNISGTTKMTLGRVPAEAAGGQLIIRKFDTDVQAQSIVYTCDKLPGMSWPGKLSSDGTFATDTINIPKSYKESAGATGGTWYAEYVAGSQDTSVWDMSYTGNGPGRPGKIRLVQ